MMNRNVGLDAAICEVKLFFGLLVAVHDQAVQEAAWLSSVVAFSLGVVRFFGDVVHGLLIGRIMLIEVGYQLLVRAL